MKKNLLILFSSAVLLLVTCKKKEECCNFPQYADLILAQKNGTAWTGVPTGTAIQDTLLITGSKTIADEQETIVFKIRLDGLGYYAPKNNESFYYITKGNQTVSSYKLNPKYNNTIIVVSANGADEIIQGRFDLKFVKTFDKTAGTHPDSVRFLEGKFKVSLHK